MKYYLQVVKDNVSILADSNTPPDWNNQPPDPAFNLFSDNDLYYGFHHFKIDDVIEVVMSDNLGISLNINGWIIQKFGARFTIDWDKFDRQELSIASAVMKGYMIDITKGVERNKKLDELGI